MALGGREAYVGCYVSSEDFDLSDVDSSVDEHVVWYRDYLVRDGVDIAVGCDGSNKRP